MNFKPVVLRALPALLVSLAFLLHKSISFHPEQSSSHINLAAALLREHEAEDEENEKEGHDRMAYNQKRIQHEFEMLRNPITGTIPVNFRESELFAVSKIAAKRSSYDPRISGMSGTATQNTYQNIGPNNVAGRTRAFAFDRRNANIIISGGVTGGIFRSTDGGANWTFVLGENDIRSVSALAQDPINPDTWYCGTGEVYYPPSASDISHGTFGWGIFKSTNNGLTWTKLAATEDAQQHIFNGQFDLVHRLVVHPLTGHVYAAIHNRIVRSTDGGATWQLLLGGVVANTIFGGLTELYIAPNGSKIFAAFSGENADRASAGIWESATGEASSWRRIAGGTAGQADSVAGWRTFGNWRRIVLTMNNAGTKLYALYKNNEDAAGASPKAEADLFMCNVSSGNSATYAWTNLSNYVPDEPGFNQAGIDPYTTQFNGYNMSLAVKPDNDNYLFIGGTAMHRINLAETTAARRFRRVGGYGSGFFPQAENFIYPDHHPDVHLIRFLSNDQMVTASDGGIHKTSTSVLADTVRWTSLNANLQTLQYQTINIMPNPEADFIVGGTQDNGTQANLNPATQLEHQQIGGGDGASSAVSTFRKTGNLWDQSIFLSVVQGAAYRINLTWEFDAATNNLSLSKPAEDDEITPNSVNVDEGQWLTLFANDADSSEHLYYNYKNQVFRTRSASTVTGSTWTELTGVASTVSVSEEVSALALSYRSSSGKYLFMGTNGGKIFRLANANVSAAADRPVAITPTTMTTGSYVAAISVNPRNADTVLAVVSNYDASGSVINNIFWTGSATAAAPVWQVLDGALAPVSVQSCAIVVKNSGVEYYVGTSVGLYSTAAVNGNSTVWFNEGTGMLKRAIVRALSNRPIDNTLVVGTHGNGAFLARIGDAVSLDVVTALPEPVTNDRRFIDAVYPTATTGTVQYRIGNLFTVKNILVQLYNMKGQLLLQEQRGYANGSINISNLARGQYMLRVYSNDRKYRHVQKLLKE